MQACRVFIGTARGYNSEIVYLYNKIIVSYFLTILKNCSKSVFVVKRKDYEEKLYEYAVSGYLPFLS